MAAQTPHLLRIHRAPGFGISGLFRLQTPAAVFPESGSAGLRCLPAIVLLTTAGPRTQYATRNTELTNPIQFSKNIRN
jgi:hypothetical protein